MRNRLCGAALLALIGAVSASPVSAGETVDITISDLAFAPIDVTIHAGDSVKWVNKDFVAHSATAKSGGFDIFLDAGKTAVRQFGKVGKYDYFCRFHPNMVGSITVVAATKDKPSPARP